MNDTTTTSHPPQSVTNMDTTQVTTEGESDWDTASVRTDDSKATPSATSGEDSSAEWDPVGDMSKWDKVLADQCDPSNGGTIDMTAHAESLENRVDSLESEREELISDYNYTAMEVKYYRFKFHQKAEEVNTMQAELKEAREEYEKEGEALWAEKEMQTSLSGQVEMLVAEKEEMKTSLTRQVEMLMAEKEELQTRLSREFEARVAELREVQTKWHQQVWALVAEEKHELHTRFLQEAEKVRNMRGGLLDTQKTYRGLLTENGQLHVRLAHEADAHGAMKTELETKLSQEAEKVAKLESEIKELKEHRQKELEATGVRERNMELDIAAKGQEIRAMKGEVQELDENCRESIMLVDNELRAEISEKEEVIRMMESAMKEMAQTKSNMKIREEQHGQRFTAEKKNLEMSLQQHRNVMKSQTSKIRDMEEELKRLNFTMERLTKSLDKTAQGLNVRARSLPASRNWVDGKVSIAIHGKYFCFHGPKYAARYSPRICQGKTVTTLDRLAGGGISSLCEMGPGFQALELTGNGQLCKHNSSPTPPFINGILTVLAVADYDFTQRYPALYTKIASLSLFGCEISHISLDADGAWSLGWMDHAGHQHHSYRLYDDLHDGTREGIARIWMGAKGTQVVECNDGSQPKTTFPSDFYPGLENYLINGINGCKTIKVSYYCRSGIFFPRETTNKPTHLGSRAGQTRIHGLGPHYDQWRGCL